MLHTFLLILFGLSPFQQEPNGNSIILHPADKTKGFHSPYFLGVPEKLRNTASLQRRTILVIPNNTGSPNDNLAFHEERARGTLEKALSTMGQDLGLIILVPVFPRPRSDWRLYTHALDRDVMLTTRETLRRPDLQLLAMIDHAMAQLKLQNIQAENKVLLFGFSASGMFVNRFTFLHPDRVQAAAFGSPGGWPLAPIPQETGKSLRYPIGTGDWQTTTGKPFDLKTLKTVPLFVFMGDKDTNDSVNMRDSYDDEDEKLIFALYGPNPVSRWPATERLYREHLPLATVKLYAGAGHTVTPAMITDIKAFFERCRNQNAK